MEVEKEVLKTNDTMMGVRRKWWTYTGNEVANVVFSDALDIQNNYSFFFRNALLNDAVYNANPLGWNNGFFNRVQWLDSLLLNRNCSGAIVDTLTSKICKNIPTVQYLTRSGDWLMQKTAKDLSMYIQGRFQHEQLDQLTNKVFAEGCKQGTSGVICRFEDGCVKYELVRVQQVRASIDTAVLDKLEDIHIIFFRNRYSLAKKYPEKSEEILKASSNYDFFTWERMCKIDLDLIPVIESYSTFANKRTLCIDNAILLEEDWELSDECGNTILPIAWFNYKPTSKNLFGKGLIEEIRTLQWEMDKVLRKIAKTSHLVLSPKILTHVSSNIKQSELNNDIARLNWSGSVPPQAMQLGYVPKDCYEQVNMYCQMMLQISGLSELTVQSQKPAGLNSGKALETMYNIESDRFQMTGQAYETLYLNINDVTLRLLNLYSDKVTQKSLYTGKRMKRFLNFKDINIDRDQIHMQPFVINSAINTPAAQLQYAQELINIGAIDKVTALKLLDLPDMSEYADIETSEYDFVMQQMHMLAEGQDVYPEIQQNLEFAKTMALKCYFDFKNKGLDDDGLQRIYNFIIQIDVALIQKTAQQTVVMQSLINEQSQMLGDVNARSPGNFTTSGYSIGPDQTDSAIRARTGQAGVAIT